MRTFSPKLWKREATINLSSRILAPYTYPFDLKCDPKREVIWMRLQTRRADGRDYGDYQLAWTDIATAELNLVDIQDLGRLESYGFDRHGRLYVVGRIRWDSDLVLLAYNDKCEVERRVETSSFPIGTRLCTTEDGYLAWHYQGINPTFSKYSWDNRKVWSVAFPTFVRYAHLFDQTDGPTVVAEYSKIGVIAFNDDGKVLSEENNGVAELATAELTTLRPTTDGILSGSSWVLYIVPGYGANGLLMFYVNRLIHYDRSGERKHCIPPAEGWNYGFLPSGRCIATFPAPEPGQIEMTLFKPCSPQNWPDLEPVASKRRSKELG